MTENEAIGYLRMATDEVGSEEFSDIYKEMCQMAIQALEEVQQYRAIGTVEECKSAVEKMKPKELVHKDFTECCPACDYHYDRSGREWIGKHCPRCGQALIRTK